MMQYSKNVNKKLGEPILFKIIEKKKLVKRSDRLAQ